MSIINVKSTTPISTLAVVFKGSVANETEKNYGISHLMEHLQCKNLHPMYENLTKYNISHNAYTTDNCIVFYMTGLEKYLSKFRKEFLDRLFKFEITESVLENEIAIVLQEYLNYFSQQASSHYYNLFRKKYGFYSAIGSRKALENISLKDCKDYYELQYSKPHMLINISQGVIFDETIEFQENYKEIEPFVEKDSLNDIEIVADFAKSTSIINYKCINEDFKELNVLCDILGRGLESPLYAKIREEKGLVYYIQSDVSKISNNQGFLFISSELENKNVKEFQKTLKEVLEEGITEERFEIVKHSLIARKERVEILNFTDYEKYIHPEDDLSEEFLSNLTFNRIKEVYDKHFNNLNESIDKEEFKEVIELPG